MRALNFLRGLPWYAIVIGVLSLTSLFLWQRGNSEAKRADHNLARYEDELKAHNDDIKSWAVASKAAEKAQSDNLANVVRKQKDISDEAVTKYIADANDWRARFERLRNQANANRGVSSQASLSGSGEATGSPSQSNSNPVNVDTVTVKIDDLEATVQAALQGKAIQDWVFDQEKVVTSPE